MVVYADEVFAINALSDTLLLCAAAYFGGVKIMRARLAASALFGGVYAAAEAVLGIPEPVSAAALAAMTAIAFGIRRFAANMANMIAVLVCTEAIVLGAVGLFGGSARISGGTVSVFASSWGTAAVYFLSYPALIAARHIKGRISAVQSLELSEGGRRAKLRVLRDTGNTLRYKGRPVIILSRGAAVMPAKFDGVVAYSTLSGAGVMPVYIPDKCRVNGLEVDAAIAVTNRGFADGLDGVSYGTE